MQHRYVELFYDGPDPDNDNGGGGGPGGYGGGGPAGYGGPGGMMAQGGGGFGGDHQQYLKLAMLGMYFRPSWGLHAKPLATQACSVKLKVFPLHVDHPFTL